MTTTFITQLRNTHPLRGYLYLAFFDLKGTFNSRLWNKLNQTTMDKSLLGLILQLYLGSIAKYDMGMMRI